MSTLKIRALTTAVLLAAALSQPALAATRAPRVDTPQANSLDQVRRDYYNDYYNEPGYNAFGQGTVGSYQGDVDSYRAAPVYPSQNLPYPDRPYGAPDRD